MAEVSEDATILLATSWQALNRAKNDGKKTEVCNCMVVIVFAAFFIEANLNHIVEAMNQTSVMNRFLNNSYAGLQDKLGWFYNQYVARQRANTKKQMYDNNIVKKLRRKFPGFTKIYKFRNNISHGVVSRKITNLSDAQSLRNLAKQIVDELFEIAQKTGFEIPRKVHYVDAITPVN